MIDYQAVKQLLADIENPTKVKFVGQDIRRHCQDPTFLSLLQYAIKDQTLPLNTQIAGATVMNKVIGQIYLKRNEEAIVKELMEIIMDMKVHHRIKQNLERNLTSILQIGSQSLFTKLLEQAAGLLDIRRQQTNMQVESDNTEPLVQVIKTVGLILKCLMNSHVHFQIFAKAICQVFLNSKLLSIEGLSAKQVTSLISLAYFWKQLLQYSRNGRTKEHTQLFKQLIRNKNLRQWTLLLYQSNNVHGQISFINPQPSLDHDNLRKIKVAAAYLHRQILIGLQVQKQLISEEIATTYLNQTAAIINTIYTFNSYRQIFQKYEDFIVKIIDITILLIKLFRKAVQPNYERMLHAAVFPLLIATEQQYKLFDANAHEFNSLAEDCCDKQNYGIPKTHAAKLLQAICDDLDSAATYAIKYAINSVKVRFNKQGNDCLTVQQAFTILAILSYRLSKHQQQLDQIRTILIVDQVKSKVRPLEFSRIYQFLAFNYKELYPSYYLGQKWVKLALQISVQLDQTYPSLVYAALDFISNVFQNYFMQDVAIKYLQLANDSKDYDLRFKILQKIISRHFMNYSEQGLCVSLTKLLQLVLKDVEAYNNNKKTNTLDIAHSLQICQKIASKPQRVKLNSPVRTKVWEFVSHLQLFQKIYKDNQVVKIVIAFVKSEGITPQVSAMIPQFIKILTPQYSQISILVFLNEIGLRINDPVTSGLFKLLLQGTAQLHSTVLYRPTSVTHNIALGTILLTLQNIVFVHGQKIGNQGLNELMQSVLLIIPISDEPEDRTQGVIIARSLNLFFICHMYKRDERALRKLMQFSDAFLFKNYDLNVLTTCLTKQLFRQTNIVSVTQMIIILVNSIWKTRQQPSNLKSKKNAKAQNRSYNKYNQADYYASLKDMTKPFEENILPEFLLRQALAKMSHNNSYLYQGIMKSLPNNIAQRLRLLISEVTIEGRKRKIIKAGVEKHNNSQMIDIPTSDKRNFNQSQDESDEISWDQGTSYAKFTIKKKRKQEEKFNSEL